MTVNFLSPKIVPIFPNEAANGLTILKSIDDSILRWFKEDKSEAAKALGEWLLEYVDRAHFLLSRWKESQTLSAVGKKNVERLAGEAKENRPTLMSEEEKTFFKFYERELNSYKNDDRS